MHLTLSQETSQLSSLIELKTKTHKHVKKYLISDVQGTQQFPTKIKTTQLDIENILTSKVPSHFRAFFIL